MNFLHSFNQSFIELRQVSIQLHELDLHVEDEIEKLGPLRMQQQMLRTQIDKLRQDYGIEELPAEAVKIIKECIEIENEMLEKFHEIKSDASSQIQSMNKSSFLKKTYESEYAQSEGYFLDKHQ